MENLKIEILHQILGYRFTDRDLAWEALSVPGSSYDMRNGRQLREGNRPLARLGDKEMSCRLQLRCYDEDLTVGNSDRRSQELLGNGRLAEVFDAVGLTNCVNRNPSQGNSISQKTKATTLEAIIGAVLLDGGFDAVEAVMVKLVIFRT